MRYIAEPSAFSGGCPLLIRICLPSGDQRVVLEPCVMSFFLAAVVHDVDSSDIVVNTVFHQTKYDFCIAMVDEYRSATIITAVNIRIDFSLI